MVVCHAKYVVRDDICVFLHAHVYGDPVARVSVNVSSFIPVREDVRPSFKPLREYEGTQEAGTRFGYSFQADRLPRHVISDYGDIPVRENVFFPGPPVLFLEDIRFYRIYLVPGTYDIITANPPYIKEADISLLDQEVRAFEPHTALSGREDGLYFYRKITAEASDYLCRDGIMVLEIGADQAESVSGMLRGHGFRDIRLVRDLGGRDRVLMAKRKT